MSSLQKKETLLIVDDSKFQRVVIRQSLGEHFNFAEAVSGEECLTIMEKESDAIDLVLLDLVMPGIDGFEVLRRRQNMEGFKDTPVIVLTNTESVSSQSEAFALGADEFIIKPVDTRIALTRINNTLGVKRRLQNSRDEQKAWKTKSQIDEMTSLFNKMTVEKLITKTLTEHENGLHALMVIDIDNFKSVNDVYGHTMGDHVISVIAGVISSQFRSTDYVGRMGGDEFAVLMGDIPSKEIALIKAENLVNLVKYKENLSIPENISISVGIAFSDPEDHCYYDLAAKADQALYVSKKSGKGRYSVFGEENQTPDQKLQHAGVCTAGVCSSEESNLGGRDQREHGREDRRRHSGTVRGCIRRRGRRTGTLAGTWRITERTCASHDRHLQGGESCTDEMCVGDGSNPGSFAGSAGSKCIEAACEDLDAKLQAAINFVIIDWSIS